MNDVQSGGRLFGGRYRVIGTLGHGGMASVYRAVDEQLGREVAVKVFRIGPVDHGERARAEAEMQALAGMRHPSLVTLYDAAIEDGDGDSFLVMELVPGVDLATRIANGVLDSVAAAGIGLQVAAGLAAVHASGIVHRDVKPANVLIETDAGVLGGNRAKLADFGIALLRDSARVTGTGTVMGTAAYLAPEQVEGRDLDGKADVYALGLVLLESLTGRQAFPGTAVESATARLTRSPKIDQSLSAGWRSLLQAMTAMQPEDRPTAAEVETRLRAIVRGDDGGSSSGAAAAAAAGAAGAAAGAAAAAAGGDAADAATRRLPATPGDGADATQRLPADDAATRRLDTAAADAPTTRIGSNEATAGMTGGTTASAESGNGAAAGKRTGAAESERRSRRTKRIWIIVAIVVGALIIAGVVAALALNRGSSSPSPSESTSDTSVAPAPGDDTSSSTEPSTEPSDESSEPAEEPSEPAGEPSDESSTEPSTEPSTIAPTGEPEPSSPASNPVESPAAN